MWAYMTDGQTYRHMDSQQYTIIPRNYRVAGYKKGFLALHMRFFQHAKTELLADTHSHTFWTESHINILQDPYIVYIVKTITGQCICTGCPQSSLFFESCTIRKGLYEVHGNNED